MMEMFEWFEDSKQMISFHIAGDNGVGKSHTVNIFAEALYRNNNKNSMIVLSGTNYQGVESEEVIQLEITFQLENLLQLEIST
jgi:ABC-type branched-subunit amino acid transport system ATPase component